MVRGVAYFKIYFWLAQKIGCISDICVDSDLSRRKLPRKFVFNLFIFLELYFIYLFLRIKNSFQIDPVFNFPGIYCGICTFDPLTTRNSRTLIMSDLFL